MDRHHIRDTGQIVYLSANIRIISEMTIAVRDISHIIVILSTPTDFSLFENEFDYCEVSDWCELNDMNDNILGLVIIFRFTE